MQKNATCTPGTYSVCFRIHDGEMMPSGNRGPPGYSGDSGERGGSSKLEQWAFYWFYPAHIFILGILTNLLLFR